MTLIGTAAKIGTTPHFVDQLLDGTANVGIADALGTTPSLVQQFLNGAATVGVADVLDITPAELQELRNRLDDNGAIGFILGLAAGVPK